MPARSGEVQDLIRKINATKTFKVVKNGQKHYKVITKAGAAVVDENGPLIISSSPSEFRFREMTVKRLMGAGVFSSDPYKETRSDAEPNDGQRVKGQKLQGGAKRNRLADPDVQAKKVEAVKAKSRRYNELTAQMRSDLEPLVVKLGGWRLRPGDEVGGGISAVLMADVMTHWAKSRGREEYPKRTYANRSADPESGARSSAQNLKKPGATIGEHWYPIWRLFVDDLLEADKKDKREGVRKRWFQLYREMKGLPGEPTNVPVMEPPGQNGQTNGHVHTTLRVVGGVVQAGEPASAEEDTTVKLGPLHHPTIPSLALEAMWLMAKGTDDQDKAMGVAEKILKLEIEGR